MTESQHPSAVVGELKLHNPQRNDKVYIFSLRTNRRVVIQSLQFVLGINIAPRSIYTRIFPNPDPPRVVDNPERILRRSNTQEDKGIFHLQRSLSLPTESVKGFPSFVFDKETDQSFSRSKSETELSQALTDPKKPNIFRPSQQPSHPSPTIVV